jgi:hypothetical protein
MRRLALALALACLTLAGYGEESHSQSYYDGLE